MKEIIRFTTLDSICCALKCQSEDVLRNEKFQGSKLHS